MDGPISTSEVAGASQQFAPVQAQSPSLDPPEKVNPVSEESAPRSSGRDEVGQPAKKSNESSDRNREAEERAEAKTQKPAYTIERHRAEPEDPQEEKRVESGFKDDSASGRAAQNATKRSPETERSESTTPLPEDSSRSERYDDLATAIAAAKERWAEVNEEALEANALPGQGEHEEAEGDEETEEEAAQHIQSFPDPSRYEAPTANGGVIQTPRFSSPGKTGLTTKALDPSAPLGETPPDVAVNGAHQRQLAIRYQSFAAALSNPHQTRPIIDIFV